MKKVLLVLIAILSIVVCNNSYAADATATVTATYTTPITIEEVRPFTFTLEKQPGVSGDNVNISSLYNEIYSTKQYFKSYSYVPGCIKITGNPNGRVKVRITPSTNIVGAKGTTITLGSGVVAARNENSCINAFSGSPYGSLANGNGIIVLNSSGIAYILWFIGGDNVNFLFYGRSATFSKIQADTFTATVTYEVWYE